MQLSTTQKEEPSKIKNYHEEQQDAPWMEGLMAYLERKFKETNAHIDKRLD